MSRATKVNGSGSVECAAGYFLDSSHVSNPEKDPNRKCTYYRLGTSDMEVKDPKCGLSSSGYAICPLREGDESFWRANALAKDLWKAMSKSKS